MKTKEKILLGARNYLLKHGQAGFTVRSVAAEADVNPGLVHHYFGSKENLVLGLIDYIANEPFEKAVQMMVKNEPGLIREAILKMLLQNSELMNLLIEVFYLAQHTPAAKEKLRQIMKQRREFITDLLGIEDHDDRFVFNAGIFGIIWVSRIDDSLDIEKSLKKLFARFDLSG